MRGNKKGNVRRCAIVRHAAGCCGSRGMPRRRQKGSTEPSVYAARGGDGLQVPRRQQRAAARRRCHAEARRMRRAGAHAAEALQLQARETQYMASGKGEREAHGVALREARVGKGSSSATPGRYACAQHALQRRRYRRCARHGAARRRRQRAATSSSANNVEAAAARSKQRLS